MMRAAALALGFVLAASIVWEPQVLVLHWPDGHEERVAATSPATCETAARAIGSGLWLPEPAREAPSATCQPGNLFQPGAEFINGHNNPVTKAAR